MLFDDSTVEAVRDPLPGWVVDAFVALTDLGNPLVFILTDENPHGFSPASIDPVSDVFGPLITGL